MNDDRLAVVFLAITAFFVVLFLMNAVLFERTTKRLERIEVIVAEMHSDYGR